MDLIFCLTFLLVASLSKGNESNMLREDSGNDDSANREDTLAFESFGSPVYGPNAIKSAGLDGKTAFNIPPPALPASYAAYISGLGYGNPYAYGPYSRLNMLPYTLQSAYGSSLLNNPAYASALLSGLGYAGYGSPYFGRSTLPGLGYPGYLSGLGYRFGNLGYPPTALKRGPAPVVPAPLNGISAPFTGIPPAVPRVASAVPAPIAPVPAFPNGFAGLRQPDSALFPFGAPLRPVQGKDGVARYAYGPDGQNLPVY